MKIAIVAPLMVTVPPVKYGGIEQIVDELARGLADQRHEVTVFCSGESTIAGEHIRRIVNSPYPTGQHPQENHLYEIKQLDLVLKHEKDFDIIHFNYEPLVFCTEIKGVKNNLLDRFSVPLIFTFHNTTDIAEHLEYYRSTPSLYKHTMIFVSENQRSRLPFFTNSQVIYNGIALKNFPVVAQKEDYLMFLGRITPDKGILEAITVAEKTHKILLIAAKIDPVDRFFYEQEVKPKIDGRLIRYVGEVGSSEKIEWLKKAKCLLFPIKWEEPFGLVMVEALACGTPVIAFCRGSVPEIIRDGINGYIVKTTDEMIDKVGAIQKISPNNCRQSVERFSIDKMVSEYESVFKKLVDK